LTRLCGRADDDFTGGVLAAEFSRGIFSTLDHLP
jgi:hypothetical protein